MTTGYPAVYGLTAGSEVIDIETSTIRTCNQFPDYPEKNAESSAVLLHNKVPLVCGGASASKTCYLYDQKTWQKTGVLNANRRQSLLLPNSPFQDPAHLATIVGGTNTPTMEVFDGTSWSYINPSMPGITSGFCGVYVNKTTIFVMGGSDQYGSKSSSNYMNSDNLKWIPGPSMVHPRNALACGRILKSQNSVTFSTIVVAGSNTAFLSSVEILDDGSNTWRSGPDLPIKAVALRILEDPRGGVIVVGGTNGTAANQNVYRLKHAGPNAQWETLPQQTSQMRYWVAAVMIPNELVNCT